MSTEKKAAEAELAVMVLETAVGPLTLVAGAKGLRCCAFGRVGEERAGDASSAAVLAEGARQLESYMKGERRGFDVPLDIRGTPFQRLVWEALMGIPYGTTVSYGEVAARVGNARAVRAVGGANNRNPLPIFVPCHRVVNSNGALHGYGGGLEAKRWLLTLEGAKFREEPVARVGAETNAAAEAVMSAPPMCEVVGVGG